METIRIPRIIQEASKNFLVKGRTVGFVPTMGALHEGHLSLVKVSKHENDVTVVSIFVNPTQFGPSEDFEMYPRDVEGDIEKLSQEDVDIVFMPDVSSMYPVGFSTHVEVEKISERLCGAFRPSHFSGVTTVVTKLLNIVKPTRAYFGQKDFQQSVLVKQLVKDLDIDVDIVVCPTVREQDGLAMSSRNIYLNTVQREAATVIYKCLKETSDLIHTGTKDGEQIKSFMWKRLIEEPAVSSIDYAGVYDPENLKEVPVIRDNVLLAIALKIGDVRLIDNMVVTGNS